MKLYVAMVDDRHCDPSPHLFTDKDRAIAYAKKRISELAGDFDNEIVENPLVDDVLYSASWESGDHNVWVVPRDVDSD